MPDASNRAHVESLMLSVCGRLIDDDEFYNYMGDKTDKPANVPFLTNLSEVLKVCVGDAPRFR